MIYHTKQVFNQLHPLFGKWYGEATKRERRLNKTLSNFCGVMFFFLQFIFFKSYYCNFFMTKSGLPVSHVLWPSGVMPERQFGGTQFVCSVVASHVSHQPSSSFSFVWIAPPPGTGCVNFLWVQLPTCECMRLTWPPKREKRWAVVFVMHSLHRPNWLFIELCEQHPLKLILV